MHVDFECCQSPTPTSIVARSVMFSTDQKYMSVFERGLQETAGRGKRESGQASGPEA